MDFRHPCDRDSGFPERPLYKDRDTPQNKAKLEMSRRRGAALQRHVQYCRKHVGTETLLRGTSIKGSWYIRSRELDKYGAGVMWMDVVRGDEPNIFHARLDFGPINGVMIISRNKTDLVGYKERLEDAERDDEETDTSDILPAPLLANTPKQVAQLLGLRAIADPRFLSTVMLIATDEAHEEELDDFQKYVDELRQIRGEAPEPKQMRLHAPKAWSMKEPELSSHGPNQFHLYWRGIESVSGTFHRHDHPDNNAGRFDVNFETATFRGYLRSELLGEIKFEGFKVANKADQRPQDWSDFKWM